MVGNDIIDLAEALQQSNWKRPRYLDKLFTLEEQKLIKYSEWPESMVWRLWSMKEAAYKLYTQLYPGRFYNPKGFLCSLHHKGIVTFKAFTCCVKTKITSEYIISEAHLTDQKMVSKIVEFDVNSRDEQRKVLRQQLLAIASHQLHCDKNELQFVKSEYGVPTILYKAMDFNVSLSHHGRFGTVAFAS